MIDSPATAMKTSAGLPWEFGHEHMQSQRQQMLASALMQMAEEQQKGAQGQMISGRYVAPNPLQLLSSQLGRVLGAKAQMKAQEGMMDVQRRYQMAERSSLANVLEALSPRSEKAYNSPGEQEPPQTATFQGDPIAAERLATLSPFARVQALAKSLAEQRLKVFEKAADKAEPASVVEGAKAGGDVNRLRPETYSPIATFDNNGQRIPYQTTSAGKVTFGPAGANISTTIGPKTEGALVEGHARELEKALPTAQQAVLAQQDLLAAYRLLKSGNLTTGKFASQVTELQAMAARLGVSVPDNVPATQFFNQIILPQFRETLRNVAPVGQTSDKEMALAKQFAASADRDPRALESMLIHGIRGLDASLQSHNKQAEALMNNLPLVGASPQLAKRYFVPMLSKESIAETGITPEQINTIFHGNVEVPSLQTSKPPAPTTDPVEEALRKYGPKR